MENQTEREPIVVQQLLQRISSNPEMTFGKAENEPMPWLATELTEEEMEDAITVAKKAKYYKLQEKIEYEAETQRISYMKGTWWPADMLKYARWRAGRKCGFSADEGKDGLRVFKLDEYNIDFVHALCFYFTGNPDFEKIGIELPDGTKKHMNWKLNKGLMVVGSVGSGKTKMMQVFGVNKRQIYQVLSAQDLAGLFARKGDDAGFEMISRFSKLHAPLAIKHEDTLWHDQIGLCIDDVGTEDDKMYFGNKSNVVAEILMGRYQNKLLRYDQTHITTNLGPEALKAKYGERVVSRMVEMFNVMQLSGPDRRAV